MALRSPCRTHRVTHRAIATVVALSLLSMPVTYRGGADAAHAHTIFQLWEDVRIGSFTHHAPEDESREPHVESTGDRTMGDRAMGNHPAENGHRSDADDFGSGHGATIDRDRAGAREPARGSPTRTVVAEQDPDAPVASSAFTPSVRGTMLALPVPAQLLVSESFASRVGTDVRIDGIVDSPTAPPPRRAA